MNIAKKILTVSILNSWEDGQSAINKFLAGWLFIVSLTTGFMLYKGATARSAWEQQYEQAQNLLDRYEAGDTSAAWTENKPEGSGWLSIAFAIVSLTALAFAMNEFTDRKIDASIERLKAEMERRDRRDPVLIAEDNDNDIELLRLKVLDDLGLTYDIAKDGEQAIGKISQRKYSAVLLDIGLPKVDGVAVFKHIQKVQPQVPIFITSGYPVDGSQIQDILSVGIAVVVPKPIKYDQLRTLLKYLCDAGKDI